ncbi:MAG: DNA polymerase/3'-5' exonuclease PolX [bacterium]
MTANAAVARMFERIADALELRGETGFRVLAYRRAARVLLDEADDVAKLDRENRLGELPGIGTALAAKIREYLATGRMKKYDEAVAGLPEELFALLDLQGLGPKTLKLLHEKLGVNNLADLKAALASGAAAELPGMGPGKAANLGRAVRLRELAGERMLLDEARELAERAVGHLEALVRSGFCVPAGSYRRGRESIGDIDVLVATDDPARVIERFTSLPGVRQVLARGETKVSLVADGTGGPRQLDLRVVEPAAWGAALQYFTGSKDHNVRLRGIARRLGLKVSEYGVFRGRKRVAGRTEAEVYAAVGLPFIEPELREDSGEFEAAEAGRLPALVRLEDIRCDLHLHTTESDGAAGFEEMLAACRARGYSHAAIADHSVSAGYAGGLDRDRLLRHCDRVDKWNAGERKPRLLKASEVDITPSGEMDFPDEVLARLDLVIASIHQGFRHRATERLCAAIAHPLVHVIAHPSGRIIGRREGYAVDLDAVIACAARHGKALEINAFYGRLDLSDAWARKAKEAGVRIAVNTDAHAVADLDWMRYGVTTARRAWLEKADVINTLPPGRLVKLLRAMRGN